MKRVRDISLKRAMAAKAQGQPAIAAVEAGAGVQRVAIHNPGLAQELTGWTLVSGDGQESFQFPAGFVLMSDSTLNVLSGPDAVATAPNDLVWTTKSVWSTSGAATLVDAAGNTVSTFSY
jgi:hypothetical protein